MRKVLAPIAAMSFCIALVWLAPASAHAGRGWVGRRQGTLTVELTHVCSVVPPALCPAGPADSQHSVRRQPPTQVSWRVNWR